MKIPIYQHHLIHKVLFSCLLFLLVGCRQPSTKVPLLPTATKSSGNSETAKPLVEATSKPTLTLPPSKTPIPPPTLTWTPLPTLSAEEALNHVQRQMQTNGNCRLPCWWGLTPGVTRWDQAYQYFATFADEFFQGDSQQTTKNGITVQDTSYTVLYNIEDGSSRGWVDIEVLDEIIVGLKIAPISTRLSFQLHQLLTDYGKPGQVFIKTYSNSPSSNLPFRLVIYYPKQHILAYYQLKAEREGDYLVACPQQIAPRLWLWPKNELWTNARIQEAVLNPETTVPLQPLEDVTSIGIETFYQLFKQSDNLACLETPAKFWP